MDGVARSTGMMDVKPRVASPWHAVCPGEEELPRGDAFTSTPLAEVTTPPRGLADASPRTEGGRNGRWLVAASAVLTMACAVLPTMLSTVSPMHALTATVYVSADVGRIHEAHRIPEPSGRAVASVGDASAGQDSTDIARAGGASEATPTTPAPAGVHLPIGPGTRVLMIGDSHTVGSFGTEMDRLLRTTGADVETYGSAGSSPSWWISGRPTHAGFVARHADGSVDLPAWNAPHATPSLRDLVSQRRADVIIVNLGANMRGASKESLQREVDGISKVAQAAGSRLIWVGPPRTRADMGDASPMSRFSHDLRAAVEPHGTYVDSAPFTHYVGADGIHYSGQAGTRVAREWAHHVFEEIQGNHSHPSDVETPP